jgi:peptidase E
MQVCPPFERPFPEECKVRGVAKRLIMATSGGFIATDRGNTRRPGASFLRALALTGKDRPKVCFVMTAAGDDSAYLTMSYEALSNYSCDVTHLSLFTQPNADVEERICGSDLVWVGGGSVANLLALWALHGVDHAMRQAWEKGTILAGVSAGSICWHVGGTTDSFGPTLRPITNGLALLPYGNGVHYDSEKQRRPLLHSLVDNGTLPLSFATDDGVGILYEGTTPIEVVSDLPPSSGTAAAYRVEKIGADVIETRLPVGPILLNG